MVSAGKPPPGDKGFWTGIEPFGESWTWDYYTYWCDMRGSPPRGQTWGNTFVRDDSLKVARGKWTCVEVMVKINDVGESNGEMALWLDGKPISHLGQGFPKGKWVFDKFMPNQGGGSIRWNDSKADREPLENMRQIGRLKLVVAVADAQDDPALVKSRGTDDAAAGRRVIDGVGDEVGQD